MLIPIHSSQAFFDVIAKARLEGRAVYSVARPGGKERFGGVLWILNVGEVRRRQEELGLKAESVDLAPKTPQIEC